MKVSLHAIGIGGFLMAVGLTSFHYSLNNLFWLVLAVLLTAFVISARMIVSDHTKKELIVGFAIGMLTQLMAYLWIL
jgi:hypothetical protein